MLGLHHNDEENRIWVKNTSHSSPVYISSIRASYEASSRVCSDKKWLPDIERVTNYLEVQARPHQWSSDGDSLEHHVKDVGLEVAIREGDLHDGGPLAGVVDSILYRSGNWHKDHGTMCTAPSGLQHLSWNARNSVNHCLHETLTTRFTHLWLNKVSANGLEPRLICWGTNHSLLVHWRFYPLGYLGIIKKNSSSHGPVRQWAGHPGLAMYVGIQGV